MPDFFCKHCYFTAALGKAPQLSLSLKDLLAEIEYAGYFIPDEKSTIKQN
jgi:hypothetical protein